jgi:transcriptional antiterminator RfaH
MKWYVAHTKPRQEFRAQENLQNQGYEIFLPTCLEEKIIKGQYQQVVIPLFPRYLFIQLDQQNDNFSPIRSTRGVNQLLRFGIGGEPVHVPSELIEDLRSRVSKAIPVKQLFYPGESVQIQGGPFKGFEAQYQKMLTSTSGEIRSLLLVEILGKQQALTVPIDQIKVT